MNTYTLAEIKNGTGFQTDAKFEQISDYEGWTNKPTWLVNLWVMNDPGLYSAARMMTGMQHDSYRLAMTIQEWIQDLTDDIDSENLLGADLLGWALACVNWEELAENWIASLIEDES